MSEANDRAMLRLAVALLEQWRPSPWSAGSENFESQLVKIKNHMKSGESDEYYAEQVELMKDRAPA